MSNWIQTEGGTFPGGAGMVPEKCDICESELTVLAFDARTKRGPWGWLCPSCFTNHGVGLGMGKGQAYERGSIK